MKLEPSARQAQELREMVQSIKETSQDLSPCGSSVSFVLDKVHRLLLDTSELEGSHDDAETLSDSLLRLSNEKLNSFPYREVPLCWRRLYTGSTLLKSISRLSSSSPEKEQLVRVIRELDMALIVAGSPGVDRSLLVFRLIAMAQAQLGSPSDASRTEERPGKRARLAADSVLPRRLDPPYVENPLPALSDLPEFLLPADETSHTRPFVVRAAASDWPAVEEWKRSAYLRAIGGGAGRVVPVEVGNDYTKEGWGQRIIPWDDFLDSMFAPPPSGEDDDGQGRETYYLAQHSLLNQFPLLARDFPIPSLVYSEPPVLGEQYEGYVPPRNEDGWIVNAWLGGSGTVSQAHTDPYWNCYVQAVGSKWVWIAPPGVSRHMATFGGGCAEDRADFEGSTSTATTGYMTNTSTIDVTQPLPPRAPSRSEGESGVYVSLAENSRYSSQYLAHVEPVAQQTVLEAGDILVMPPGWWHAMKSLETSFSISIWF